MTHEPFGKHRGVAAPMLIDNVDTDQIIPSREMKTVSRDGLGEGLFAGWRYLDPVARTPDPEFVLNQTRFQNASILLAGLNFGCGSSREHAVWALKEYGVRCIIARSFGEIFHANCGRNGILPVVLEAGAIDALTAFVSGGESGRRIEIDLGEQRVSPVSDDALSWRFEIDAYQKRLLMEGLDPIGLTLTRLPEIEDFIGQDKQRRPWVY